MNEMNLWIINHYADTPQRQVTRSYDIAKCLVEKGYRVTIFASSFNHYSFQEEKLFSREQWKLEDYNGVRFAWIRTFPYTRNNWRRFLNLFGFSVRVFILGLQMKEKPNVIMGKVFHPLAPLVAYLLSRIKKCVFFFEIGDLWPQTLIEIGGFSPRNPVVIMLRHLEKFLCKKAKRIVVLLPYAKEYLLSHGIAEGKIFWLPNGVDSSYYKEIAPYNGNLSNPIKIMYLGGITHCHSIRNMISSAEMLQREYSGRFKFILVGGGVEWQYYIELAEKLNLSNIEFRKSVSKLNLYKIIEEADVFLLGLKNQPIYKYGVSPNKLFDYLSSGRPIIFDTNARFDYLKKENVGIFIPPEDPRQLVKAILDFVNLSPLERKQMGERGVACVKKYHDINKIADILEREILLCYKGR